MKNFRIGDDKLGFLKAVKAAFEYNRIKYHQFLKLLKDLRAGRRIDIRGEMTRVKKLFKGHTDLILGLKKILPTG
ncbi:paired amphipathic helix protein [Medicago truncatula]|uniref:Paired amphipathic helix protein n=1 Tax=Medicago truncatula TaxID=3880 RepID=A0A072VPT4_MEDTR|nr:paired amphipathic helix protein [Medicago truncatula]